MSDPVAQQALDRALDESEDLLLVYQPIHDVRDGSIYGAEALLRQRRQSGEIREASIITEAAEESYGPELFQLDSMVVKKAYTEAARWPGDVRLHVNLSPREFQEGNVVKRLSALLTSCGIDTRKVNLEITETTYIDHPEETMDVLQSIKEMGIALWLDDFGTGHSSMEHLQHFPLAGLKIAGSFVKPLPKDERCRAIVRSLIALAHELKLRVVAEGVENGEQLALLREFGCHYVQGFLFNKPMSGDRFATLLSQANPSGSTDRDASRDPSSRSS